MKFLDLWRQSFHPGCQSCILLGYMNFLWDVGIRSDITWRETLFEPWQKKFDLFVKTALYVSKGTLWVKKQLLKVLIFFKHFRFLNERSPCLAKKFSAGISKLKIAVFVSKYQSKNPTSESSFFFKFFRTLNEHLPCLAKNFSAGISKLKVAVFVSKVQSKNQTSQSSLFSNSSKLWTNIYRVWRKTFRQGYQNWKLQSSSQKINQKPNFWKFSFFSNSSKTFTKPLPCLAKNFSAGISKLKIAVFVS